MDKWGLVLSGGGANGAYEIGAWNAINEAGIKIEAVSGTSVGALNAALFSCGSFNDSLRIWTEQVDTSKILSSASSKEIQQLVTTPTNKAALTKIISTFVSQNIAILPFSLCDKDIQSIHIFLLNKLIHFLINRQKTGTFSQKGLLSIINENNIYDKFQTANFPCYTCSFNIKSLNKEYTRINNLPKDEFNKHLLASSAIPIVFPPIEFDSEHKYVDGGIPIVGDNCPISPLIENEHCNKIIVIHLSPRTGITPIIASSIAIFAYTAKFFPVAAAPLTVGLPLATMTSSSLIHFALTLPAKRAINMIQNNYTKHHYNDNIDIYHIYPRIPLGFFVNFNPKHIAPKIEIGYSDTKKALKKLL